MVRVCKVAAIGRCTDMPMVAIRDFFGGCTLHPLQVHMVRIDVPCRTVHAAVVLGLAPGRY